jgi:protocatechuate 3,4-dioxygenase beta subunit
MQFPAFCLAIIFPLFGQVAPSAFLEGTVVNSVTGHPIPNATISAPTVDAAGRQTSFTARTDSDGHFRLVGLRTNYSYYITVRKRGYFGALNGTEFASLNIQSASPGSQSPELKIPLIPQAILSGRVLDEYGEPVQGAKVQAGRLLQLRGQPSYKEAGSSPVTNDKGEFRITGLLPGSYYLLVRHEDLESDGATTDSKVSNYLPTYFPGTGNLLAAQPIPLTAGLESPSLEIKLKRERVFRVTGHVLGLEPDNRSMLSVELLPQDPLIAMLRFAQSQGSIKPGGEFEMFFVPPGAYTLVARLSGTQGKPMIGTTPVTVSQNDVTGVQVAFAPLPEMTGRLILEGPGIEKVDWTKFFVNLESPGTFSRVDRSTIDAKGAFRQTYEIPGFYFLNVNGPTIPNAYLDSIRVGTTEMLGKAIDFTAGQPGPIQITYRTSPGEVNCRLEASELTKPGERTTVYLLPVDPLLRRFPFAQYAGLAGAGKFSFKLVRPDDYLLLAIPGQGIREFAQGYELPPELEKAATKIHVDPNGKYDIEVKLYRPTSASVE